MNLSHRIQAKTDNGDTVIDFLIEVMTDLPRSRYGSLPHTRYGSLPRSRNGDERNGFKMCHRLGAARLLTRYGCSCKSTVAERDDAIDFIIDNPPEPSGPRSDSGSSTESTFDIALAKKIKESTDDGASVVRFLINVMEGELKAFGPHHSMAAARELLSRGFGKHAREEAAAAVHTLSINPPLPGGEGWGEGEKHEDQPTPSHSSLLSTHSSEQTTEADPDSPHKPEEQAQTWAAFWEEVAPIIESDDRLRTALAQPEPDPDNPPHVSDLSAFDEAWEKSQKWFYEWKNSLDPEEFKAIMAEEAAKFNAMIDTKLERRNQIAADRERRAKEEAERQAQQAKARAEAQAKVESEPEAPPDPGPPPTRDEHKRWSPTPNIPTSFRLVKCGHPRCKLHDGPIYYPEDDRNSPYYFDGRAPPMYINYPL